MFLGGECTSTGDGGSDGSLKRHFLIGCPFTPHFVVLYGELGDLRAGCTGITGYEPAAGLVEALGNGLVSKQKFLHRIHS